MSLPSTRKRSVESSKSYGSGKGSSNVVEGLERRVRAALALELVRQPAAGEHEVGGSCRAPVGHAVSRVRERPVLGKRSPFTHVTAHRAGPRVAKTQAPAAGQGVGLVRADLE